MVRPKVREGLAPNLHTDLPFGGESGRDQTALGCEKFRVGRELLEAEGRFELAGLDLSSGKVCQLMKISVAPKLVRVLLEARVRPSHGQSGVALGKVAFSLEVEVLGIITTEADPGASNPEPVLNLPAALREAPFEGGDIPRFYLRLNESAERELEF